MNRCTRFLVGALLVGAAACSGITANSNIAPGANLSQYHTYAWYVPPGGQAMTPAAQEVKSALQTQLAEKGLVPATNGPPDFLIAVQGRKQQQLQAMGGYGFYGFPDVYSYTEGTLIVDFIDPRTKRAFWRGTASGVMNQPNNPDFGQIDKAVAKLVQQYPSQLAATSRPAM